LNAIIHPTAIVEEGSRIGDGSVIGPYAYIGAQVVLGERCEVRHHATVEGNTRMGPRNVVHPYCLIGGKTQDLKFKGGNPGLVIGEGNDFREYSSVHCATNDGECTVVGSFNHFLAYTHIAHDCILGDHIVASNNCGIAGHVRVGDHVVLGGMVGIHQFCRIGDHAMVGAMSKVTQDVPPFAIAEGNPAKTRTINKVGLERRGFDRDTMHQVREVFRILYKPDTTRAQAIAQIREMGSQSSEVARILAFLESAERGIC
jgi:UDP-N-acetylglucosamine acyltransferase